MKRWIITVAVAAVTMPVQGHWQYTRWGMTSSQVIAGSKGTVQSADPSLDEEMPFGWKEAAGTYVSAGRPLKASFWFKGGKLLRVNLASDDEDTCLALRRDLVSLYEQAASGSPVTAPANVWIDRIKGNRVQFSSWGPGGCDVIYSPLPTASDIGL
jgi:hypothetical protein